jgi:GNAT superfamily N-acetyltransferase
MESNEQKEFICQLTFEPLSKNNWDKFVQLFGSRGACSNCWCMSFRCSKSDFMEGKENNGNKKLMKKLVWENKPTGILGFYNGQAIAWCAFAPRDVYLKIENSRIHKRIDDKPVWSIPCFFIDKGFRRKGVSVAMLKAVINYASEKKIPVIEAYPTIPTQEKLPDTFAWIGLYKSFEKAGFEIADRTSKNRPMVRYYTNK